MNGPADRRGFIESWASGPVLPPSFRVFLEKTSSRAREALVEAIGMALSTVTSENATSFFAYRDYPLAAQPPR